MTRLREEDISHIPLNLNEYNKKLLKDTGKSLGGIAAYAAGTAKEIIYNLWQDIPAAVIPITCGEGIINGFSISVQRIIDFLGFSAFVTDQKDVGGLAEAVEKGAKIIFLADDNRFVAINILTGKVVDNGEATGKGYAAALDLLSGGLRDKQVLLIGAGPVGTGASGFMSTHGAKVFVYDINREQAEKLKKNLPEVEIINNFYEALSQYDLLFDASPAEGIIGKEQLGEHMMISAPGIPLGLTRECLPLVSHRLIHDALEIGVATMLFDVLT
jgi:pyrrolysine biosynthesis protein PylD